MREGDWQPIAELREELKDGRPVLLWVSYAKWRTETAPRDYWSDHPVTGKWCWPGGIPGGRGYWALTQCGGYAEDDDVEGDITHFAEVTPPASEGAG